MIAESRAELQRWLLCDGPSLDYPDFVRALSVRLNAAGVPVERLWTGRLFLNPLIAGDTFCYYRDGRQRSTELPFARRAVAAPESGPLVRRVYDERVVHQPLVGLERGAFNLSVELFDDGYTDLLALSVTWGPADAAARVAITLATRDAGGFTPEAVATVESALDALRLVIRAGESERLTRALLGTYLGGNAADRVLRGQVRRGDGETIRAALWFSDLRGFTTLSDTLSREELLGMLDDAFEVQAAAIHAHGGEVLKFIGDGLLAVFRGDPEVACPAALAASRDFEQRLADVNAARAAAARIPVKFGLALHHGDVMYGNIGAPDRLDFTVIGPAVNLAARLEGLSSRLGRNVVLSETFANSCGVATEALGEQAVKGLQEPVRVFAAVPRIG